VWELSLLMDKPSWKDARVIILGTDDGLSLKYQFKIERAPRAEQGKPIFCMRQRAGLVYFMEGHWIWTKLYL
jgi:predicted KAP-like P-loop ATPase